MSIYIEDNDKHTVRSYYTSPKIEETIESLLKYNKELMHSESLPGYKVDIVEEEKKLPYPLCIVEDRYGGAYSGASFLAFNMSPMGVSELPIDAGDTECLNFWDGNDKDYALDDYIIGKGDTPEEALQNLISLLSSKEV